MTRTLTTLWAALVALAFILFPIACADPNDDTGPEGDADADTDTDADGDTDADADVFATAVAHILDGEPTSFSIYSNFDPLECEDVATCRIDVHTPTMLDIYAKREGMVFASPKQVDLTHGGEVDTLWDEGQFGARFPERCVETDEDDGREGNEHELDIFQEDGLVKLLMSGRYGCALGSAMTGLAFIGSSDGYTCSGHGTGINYGDELVVDYGSPGYDPIRFHCEFF